MMPSRSSRPTSRRQCERASPPLRRGPRRPPQGLRRIPCGILLQRRAEGSSRILSGAARPEGAARRAAEAGRGERRNRATDHETGGSDERPSRTGPLSLVHETLQCTSRTCLCASRARLFEPTPRSGGRTGYSACRRLGDVHAQLTRCRRAYWLIILGTPQFGGAQSGSLIVAAPPSGGGPGSGTSSPVTGDGASWPGLGGDLLRRLTVRASRRAVCILSEHGGRPRLTCPGLTAHDWRAQE